MCALLFAALVAFDSHGLRAQSAAPQTSVSVGKGDLSAFKQLLSQIKKKADQAKTEVSRALVFPDQLEKDQPNNGMDVNDVREAALETFQELTLAKIVTIPSTMIQENSGVADLIKQQHPADPKALVDPVGAYVKNVQENGTFIDFMFANAPAAAAPTQSPERAEGPEPARSARAPGLARGAPGQTAEGTLHPGSADPAHPHSGVAAGAGSAPASGGKPQQVFSGAASPSSGGGGEATSSSPSEGSSTSSSSSLSKEAGAGGRSTTASGERTGSSSGISAGASSGSAVSIPGGSYGGWSGPEAVSTSSERAQPESASGDQGTAIAAQRGTPARPAQGKAKPPAPKKKKKPVAKPAPKKAAPARSATRRS